MRENLIYDNMNIILKNIKWIRHAPYGKAAPGALSIETDMTESIAREIFYQFWAEYGNDVLKVWLNSEGYNLVLCHILNPVMIRRINHSIHTNIPLRNEGLLWVILGNNVPYTDRPGPTWIDVIMVASNRELGTFSFYSYKDFKRFKDSLKCRT